MDDCCEEAGIWQIILRLSTREVAQSIYFINGRHISNDLQVRDHKHRTFPIYLETCRDPTGIICQRPDAFLAHKLTDCAKLCPHIMVNYMLIT